MSRKEIDPKTTTRAVAFELWMNAPNPMVTFFKTYDIMPIIQASKRFNMKLNMLMLYCIGQAASSIKEFELLPLEGRLYKFDQLAINTIVANKKGEISSCDIRYTEDLKQFNANHLHSTQKAYRTCKDQDLSLQCMVIGTSAIVDVELDGAIGMNSGIFNNPFLIWGKYRIDGPQALLTISFQFHHTQMDGKQAGCFLKKLEEAILTFKIGTT